MLKQLQKRKNQTGFTIIEVLIVLAIAGLIMVVVFLAVPALQRSGRNNAISTDANNVLSAVGNFVSDNAGTLPTSVSLSGSTVTISGATGSNSETATVDTGVSAVSTYVTSPTATGTKITNASPIGSVQVVIGTGSKCNGTDSDVTTGASPRSYSVLYVAESGSGNILKCVGS